MMRSLASFAAVLLGLAALAAASCGAEAPIVSEGAAGSGSDGAAGSTGGSTGTVAIVRDPRCPVGAPVEGAACEMGASCEYRDASAPRGCSTVAACPTGTWALTPPAATCGAKSAGGCPATFTSLADRSYCPTGVTGACDYPEGRCQCMPCQSHIGATPGYGTGWMCRMWNTGGEGCPVVPPLGGTACGLTELICSYSGSDTCIGIGPEDYHCGASGYWEVVGGQSNCTVPFCMQVTAG
jgi:hypothetical protein